MDEARWTKHADAQTSEGVTVSVHHPDAVRFSLIGALIRCYVPKGQQWCEQFENKRSALFNAIASDPALREQAQKLSKVTSLQRIRLGALNTEADYAFVEKLMVKMKTEKKEP